MRVLVTGGCGLIGFNIAKHYVQKGHNVEVMDNLERSSLLGHSEVEEERTTFNFNELKELGVRTYRLDVSEQKSWNLRPNYDVIFHMAAQCGVPTSIENPRRDFEVNVQGTFNALEHARKTGGTLIYASTNKVYPIHDNFRLVGDRWQFDNDEWNQNGFPARDMNKLSGSRTPYGWSKYSGDLLCQEWNTTYGVRTGVFRMSCIYGKNQFGFEEQGWATWFSIATQKNLPITIFGDGKQVRDMLYVEDVVGAYDAFLRSDLDSGVFNLGGGWDNTISLNECLTILEEIYGKRSPITYEDWRPLDQKCYVSDISALREGLGWSPKVDPKTGLTLVSKWVKDNINIF
jgi:CDP-paratose 2-epimerase